MENRNKKVQIFIVFLLIICGILFLLLMKLLKPEIEKKAPVIYFPKAFVIKSEIISHNVIVKGHGSVKPLNEIQIIPETSGKIVYVSENFINGGIFKKGEVLLKIDPVDYQLTVQSADARVKDSEMRFSLANQESEVAKEEWYQVHNKSNRKISSLVAKTPQLEAARAKLKADKAELKRAKLKLERCIIRAPFNGRVHLKKTDKGQFVSPGQIIGTIFSTDIVEISISLEDKDLFWLSVPGFTTDSEGSTAKIYSRIAGINKVWNGRIVRSEGKIDENTRMIKVVIRVENPYIERPPLAVGLFVNIEIKGRKIENCVIIPRTALRGEKNVWIVGDDNILKFKKVEVAKSYGNNYLISSGIKNGDNIVVSKLRVVSDGMKVKKVLSGKENG